MTLIKCPSCDHTISSVASKCPRCGYLLTQLRYQQGHQGSLTECRKCGRKVLSKARVCPYCGLNAPGRRPRVAALFALGVIASALAILALQERMVSGQLSVAESGAASDTTPEQSAARPAAKSASAPTATAAPPDSLATAAAPHDTVAATPAAESLAVVAPSADSVSTVPTQTRWAADWANIREARSLEAPVLGVVRRGEPVQVANQVEGWWEVYRGGRFIGYVAGDLLLAEPRVIP